MREREREREREQIGSNNWQYIEQGSKSTEMPIIVGFGPTMEFQTVLSCLLACFNISIFLAQYYNVKRGYPTVNMMICNKLMFVSYSLNHVHSKDCFDLTSCN